MYAYLQIEVLFPDVVRKLARLEESEWLETGCESRHQSSKWGTLRENGGRVTRCRARCRVAPSKFKCLRPTTKLADSTFSLRPLNTKLRSSFSQTTVCTVVALLFGRYNHFQVVLSPSQHRTCRTISQCLEQSPLANRVPDAGRPSSLP